MARKIRSDSKLDKLSLETRQELIDMFIHENAGLPEAREWLKSLDKPVSISLSGLHTWPCAGGGAAEGENQGAVCQRSPGCSGQRHLVARWTMQRQSSWKWPRRLTR